MLGNNDKKIMKLIFKEIFKKINKTKTKHSELLD